MMSEHPPDRPTFTITLRPDKNCGDPVKALRALLKIALRRFKFRCISVAEGRRP
jgi:hypothetical protein